MNTLKFSTSNNGTMCLSQNETDGAVTVHNFEDFLETKNDTVIPSNDMVMLIYLYKFVKKHDIQLDFINPNGKTIL